MFWIQMLTNTKLVFARGYEGKVSYSLRKPRDRAALVQATGSELDNFIGQLNKAGAQGYKTHIRYLRWVRGRYC